VTNTPHLRERTEVNAIEPAGAALLQEERSNFNKKRLDIYTTMNTLGARRPLYEVDRPRPAREIAAAHGLHMETTRPTGQVVSRI